MPNNLKTVTNALNADLKPTRAKNRCAKTRKADNPYEIWSNDSWTWLVLKKWQVDDSKPFARWYCLVKSPYVPNGEYGDVYASEIRANARRVV